MRVRDQPEDWDLRIGEVEIIDPTNKQKYILVVGYRNYYIEKEPNPKLFIRLYKEDNSQINGDWLQYFTNYTKWGISEELHNLIKIEIERLQKLEIFA